MSNAAIGKDTHMLKFTLTWIAVPGVLLSLATATAAQTFPPNRPTAITCYVPQDQSWRVVYLHKIHANGDAIYMTVDGKLASTLNAKGIVEMPTDRSATADCYGKTLDELRTNGRVLEFQRAVTYISEKSPTLPTSGMLFAPVREFVVGPKPTSTGRRATSASRG